LSIGGAGAWSNTGVIRVVDSTSSVTLGGTFSASTLGTLENSAGGKVNLGGTFNNTGSTLALTSTTGSLTLFGGTINGGTVQQNGTNALVFTSSQGTLDGVTIRGAMNVGDATTAGAIVRVRNGLVVQTEAGGSPGVINVGTVAGSSGSTLAMFGTQTLNNATINLGNAAGSSVGYVSQETGGTLTLGSGTTVQGYGGIGGARVQGGGVDNLVNAGTISANFNGRALTINNSGTLTNSGTLEARNGGTLNITNAAIANFSGSTLTDGSWKAFGSGSTVNIFSGVVNTNAANIVLSGAGSLVRTFNTTTGLYTSVDSSLSSNAAAGALRVLDNRNFSVVANGGNFANNGVIQLGGGTFTAGALTNNNGSAASEISGFGTVTTSSTTTGNGSVRADGGALVIQRGVNGASAVARSDLGGTLSLGTVAGAVSTVGQLVNNGSLNLNANNVNVNSDYNNANFGSGNSFNARANVAGTGQIVGTNASQTITGTGVTVNGANNFTLNLGNTRVGGSVTGNFQVANNGTGADIRGAVQTSVNGGALTDSRISGLGATAGNFGPVAAGSNSGNLSVTLAGSGTAGAVSGQSVAIASNFSNVATQVVNFTGGVYNIAVGSTTGDPVTLANQRVGGSATQVVSVSNTAAAGSFSEALNEQWRQRH
jgi:hypothetical protein